MDGHLQKNNVRKQTQMKAFSFLRLRDTCDHGQLKIEETELKVGNASIEIES